MSYQKEREQFIAQMAREGMPLRVTLLLLREATGLNRRAELACSSEAANRDRVPCPRKTAERLGYLSKSIKEAAHTAAKYPCLCDAPTTGHQTIPRITLQDWQAEQRIMRHIEQLSGGWAFSTVGDPRGYTLKVIPPSYAERNADRDIHNLESIGVPPGPSRMTF